MQTEQKIIRSAMLQKASNLSTDELKLILLEDAANPVFETVLFEVLMDNLESRITEKEFTEFCDKVNELY